MNCNKNFDLRFLENIAYNLRMDVLKATTKAGSGHLTSALSAADLITALYFHVMNFDFKNPLNAENDRFILSKGHAAIIVYAALKELGILTEEEFMTYRGINSPLEGHPTRRFIYNEAATGSLGQGLSIGLGMSLSARLRRLAPTEKKTGRAPFYTYVMLGDSEMTEGSVWEAIELAAYYKVDNLVAIVDFNRLGQTTETIDDHLPDLHAKRWQGFGWFTIIVNGHDINLIIDAFNQAKKIKGQPTAIIAKTYKGYGIDHIEDKEGYHGKALLKEKLPELLKQLERRFSQAAKFKYKKITHSKFYEKLFTRNCETRPHSQDLRGRPLVLNIVLPDPEYKKGDKKATRHVYGETLAKLGDSLKNLISLDAEVKNSTFAEIFEKNYPERFIQCFVAEQNMIGMAVGLASRGFMTFSSTFASFLTRAHDQIRMAAIGQVPLRIAGSHVGVSIGEDGPSQMGLEDIAQMRALCDSVVLYPCDAVSAYKLINRMANYNHGISYIRLTRPETPIIYEPSENFEIGGCKVLKQSKQDQLCIITAGITVFEALKAYEQLEKDNIKVSIIDLYSIKPLDIETVSEVALKSNKKIITVEDHYIQGGLGEAVCFALRNKDIHIESLAIKTLPRSGKPEDLMALHKIDAKAIIDLVYSMLKVNPN